MLRCSACYATYQAKKGTADLRPLCLNCGSSVKPLDSSLDVQPHLNWDELRKLFFYSQAWLRQVAPEGDDLKALELFARRLNHVRPVDAPPLLAPAPRPTSVAHLALVTRKGLVIPLSELIAGDNSLGGL